MLYPRLALVVVSCTYPCLRQAAAIHRLLQLTCLLCLDTLGLDPRSVQDQVMPKPFAVLLARMRIDSSDWDVYRNCSPDAYYYLLFHTYLIAYLLFVTIFSLTIILPVNFQGTQGNWKINPQLLCHERCFLLGTKEQKFAHTTIANLPPK
jgi:hypothetical protein